MVTSREFLVEKGLALLPVAIGVAIGDLHLFILAAMLLGQGHFTLSYVYKLKSRKVKKHLFVGWCAVAGAMFTLFWSPDTYRLLLCVTSIYLVTHFVVDDRHLIGSEADKYSSLEMGTALALYYALILQTLYGGWLPHLLVGAAGAMFGRYVWCAWRERYRPDVYNGFFLAQILFLFGLVALDRPIDTGWINAGAGIYHYMVWYVAYGRKVRHNQEARRSYVSWVIAINGLILALFLVHQWAPQSAPVLKLAFTQHYFLIWAFLHFASATRFSDIRHLTQVNWRLAPVSTMRA